MTAIALSLAKPPLVARPERAKGRAALAVLLCAAPCLASAALTIPEETFTCGHVFQNGFELAGARYVAPGSAPIHSGRLNDTGILFCAGDPVGNQAPCTGDKPPGQDAHHGRDALALAGQLDKIGGGGAGFDFSKISNRGEPLPESAALGSGPDDWACTRDNTTGLIWEIKLNDVAHLRHRGHRYTWYMLDSVDGSPGVMGNSSDCRNTMGGRSCNTHQYVAAVNAAGLCGANDWRVPTRHELQSIVDHGRYNSAIDNTYFVYPPIGPLSSWSSSPYAGCSNHAWSAEFYTGSNGISLRSDALLIRLVRDDK